MKKIIFLFAALFALPSAAEDVSPVHEAAIHGNAGAQFQMCGLYYMGQRGIPKNLLEAANWCLLAAQQGHTEAQYNLALMYQKGEGVGQNIPEAVIWYKEAARKGHRLAQYNLSQIAYANNQRKRVDDKKDSDNKTAALAPARPINSNAPASSSAGNSAPQPAPAAPVASKPLPPAAPQVAAPAKLTQKEIACHQAASKGIVADNCIEKPAEPAAPEIALVPKKEIVQPVENIASSANSGDTAAMLKLAESYKNNPEQSFAWYNLAADRLPEGDLKKAALTNIKTLSQQLNTEQMSRALNLTTELDKKIPLLKN